MPTSIDNFEEPDDGSDIQSTLDMNYQDVAEASLEELLIQDKAHHGCVVLMEVASGEIKAMVLSIRHEHVVQEHPKLLQTIYSLRKLSLFVIRLPLALLGIFLNAAPYFLTKLVGQLKIPADRASTAKLVAGLVLYPLCWTVQSGMLENEFFPAYVWWILAPLSGVSSLLFRERHAQLLEELRTYLKLNNHAEMKDELEQRLENICLEVTELLAISAASQLSAQHPAAQEKV